MRFAFGGSRFVVLIGPYAIKFARLRLIRAAYRLLFHLLHRQAFAKLRSFGTTVTHGGVRYLLSGVIANRHEFRLWRQSPQTYLVPTLFSFFGLVNIQVRGERISEAELSADHPFPILLQSMTEAGRGDMMRPVNFCRLNGHVMLVDYGSDECYRMFSRSRRLSLSWLFARP